ncbi:hypothetical protein NLI96_g7366 [Meripilus lineatus]|uniref:Uncharacterized protein n=1 Tax=Meripilus lineatus TaxID=2056292 RepID=A0AAD5V450_9APHY|nr:hypothetical protein NLI96_g7366 [Physisporinus lineatus]
MTQLTELVHILYLYSVFKRGKYLSVQGQGWYHQDDSDDEESEVEEPEPDLEETVKNQKPARVLDSLINHDMPLIFHCAIARVLVRNEDEVFAVSSYLPDPEQDSDGGSSVILCVATEGSNPISEDVTKYLEKTWEMLQGISRSDFARGRSTKGVAHRIVPDDILPLWNGVIYHIFWRCYPKFRSTILGDCNKAKEFSATMRRRIPQPGDSSTTTTTTTSDLKQLPHLLALLDVIDEVLEILEANEPGSPVSDRESEQLVFEVLVKGDERWRWTELESLAQWQSIYETDIRISLQGSYILGRLPTFHHNNSNRRLRREERENMELPGLRYEAIQAIL